MKNPFKNIISTRKAAKIFGKTERQIRNWCKDDKLKAQLLDPEDPKSPWLIYLPPNGEYENRSDGVSKLPPRCE